MKSHIWQLDHMQNKDGEIINNYELKNNLFDSLNRQNDDLKYSTFKEVTQI